VNPVVRIENIQLRNGTSVGNGAYTLYSINGSIPFLNQGSNLAAVIDGKTYRTPWGSSLITGGFACFPSSASRLRWDGLSFFLGFVVFWILV
jgi:hypothetical protein